MCKTEVSPTGLGKNFGRLNEWTNPQAKVVDFVPLGTLFGPGPPDPDLALVNTPNSLKFHWFYWHFDPWAQEIIRIPQVLLTLWSMAFPWPHRNHWNSYGFINILNSWTNHKFRNALNSLGVINNLIHKISIDSTKPLFFLSQINKNMFEANGRWTRWVPAEENISPKSA